jgi:hypothetical protein
VVDEPTRDRHQPLASALPISDEHSPLGHPQIGKTQPEQLAAAQRA